MKIFISHSTKDSEICLQVADALREAGHEVFIWQNEVQYSESPLEVIKENIDASDLVIAIITENFINSSWAQAELSAVAFGTKGTSLLPVVVGDIYIPSFIANFQYRKVENVKEVIPAVLSDVLRMSHAENSKNFFEKQVSGTDEAAELAEKIRLLKKALHDNQLTLVCGAGISISSGVPDWNELLARILNKHVLIDDSEISAKDLLARLPSSNLILGKYFRILLKDDFEETVRKCLYEKVWFDELMQPPNPSPLHTDMMKAIIEIARPKRN